MRVQSLSKASQALTDFTEAIPSVSTSDGIMSTSIGSLVGGVLATRDDATDELRARTSEKCASGVFGSCGDDEVFDFDALFAAGVAETSLAFDFSALAAWGFALGAGVLKPAAAFGAGVAVEPVAFGLEKKEVRLFCFRDSVEGFVLGAMVKVARGVATLAEKRYFDKRVGTCLALLSHTARCSFLGQVFLQF